MLRTTVALTMLFGCVTKVAVAEDDLKAFPQPDEGMVRFVLRLPELEDEALLKVELLVGKVVKLDERNRYFFAGKLDTQTIEGWGYKRYVLEELGPMAGTLIAVDPAAPKVERFITLGGEPYLIPYNSRLPVVVYVPQDVEVRYRIWRTEPETTKMSKG